MAVGLPFISTNVGMIKDLRGGVIIYSYEEMADYINRFLDNLGYRRRFGCNGKNECFRKFTWDKIVPMYEKVFEGLVRGR